MILRLGRADPRNNLRQCRIAHIDSELVLLVWRDHILDNEFRKLLACLTPLDALVITSYPP